VTILLILVYREQPSVNNLKFRFNLIRNRCYNLGMRFLQKMETPFGYASERDEDNSDPYAIGTAFTWPHSGSALQGGFQGAQKKFWLNPNF